VCGFFERCGAALRWRPGLLSAMTASTARDIRDQATELILRGIMWKVPLSNDQ
jgi:hypothetical protein